MSNQAPIVDRIRIIPRPNDFLDRNVGASGEVFYNKQTNSLRLYNGRDTGGYDVVIANSSGALDITAQKNKVRFHWDTLSDLNTEVDPSAYHGMIAHVHAEGRLYFAHADAWVPVANFSELGDAGGGASVDVSETAPTEPEAGNIWFNSLNGRLYVYINDGDTSQWVQPSIPIPTVNVFSTIGISGGDSVTAAGAESFNFSAGSNISLAIDTETNVLTINSTAGAADQTLNTDSDVVFNSVSAASYTNTGVGAPILTSTSTITLTAPDGVLVQSGPFRLPSFTTSEKNDLTANNGDMVYDSTLNKAQVYENGAWASIV